MRWFLLAVLLVTAGSASAQNIQLPLQCNERLLTPTVEALCTELKAVSISTNERYLRALGKADTLERWQALRLVQLQFMVYIHKCALQGNSRGVIDCLAPAFEEALNRLQPLASGPEVPISSLEMLAHQANNNIEELANGQFRKCLVGRIEALDDGISPAHDIALGIGAACRPQASSWADIRYATVLISFITQTSSIEDRQALVNQILDPDNLVKTVLEFRAVKRAAPQPKKKATNSRRVEG